MNKIFLVAFCLIAASHAVNLKGILQKALMEQLMEQQQQNQKKRSEPCPEPTEAQVVQAINAWMGVFDTKFDFNCNNKTDEADHQVLYDNCCPVDSAVMDCKAVDPSYDEPERVFCDNWDVYKSG